MSFLAGRQCASEGTAELASDGAATSLGSSGSPASGGSSTGVPFDASRWIGRYHYENVFLPFGERGDPLGTYALQPGPGEPWLRHPRHDPVSSIRVQLVEPCRELWFEGDGRSNTSMPFRPGLSCWVDRCTTPIVMQVDYCEGEAPPPCP